MLIPTCSFLKIVLPTNKHEHYIITMKNLLTALSCCLFSCAEEEDDFYKSYSLSKPLAEQIPDANFRKAIERGGMNAIDLMMTVLLHLMKLRCMTVN